MYTNIEAVLLGCGASAQPPAELVEWGASPHEDSRRVRSANIVGKMEINDIGAASRLYGINLCDAYVKL